MSKFCPEWIFSTFAAQTSKEFLSSNNSIAAISRKYSTAISERFNEVKFEEIMDLAEKILQFLSEINAGEDAVNYINDFMERKKNQPFLVYYPMILTHCPFDPTPHSKTPAPLRILGWGRPRRPSLCDRSSH